MKKILVAGVQHETNTFSPIKTHYENFLEADAWPGLLQGEEIIATLDTQNIALAGFLQAAKADQQKILPIVWCSAEPAGIVTDAAFETITAQIIQGVKQSKDFAAVYLDLHGAMVTESYADAEAELLTRLRKIIPAQIPIVLSLDFHANVSPQMLHLSTAMLAFKTYPHIDQAATGKRAYQHLMHLFSLPQPLCKAYKKLPFFITLTSQCTLIDPWPEIYKLCDAIELDKDTLVTLTPGFPLADTACAGPTIVTYAKKQAEADAACKSISDFIANRKDKFKTKFYTPIAAVTKAMQLAMDNTKPVILADTQDNPGAGGACDSVGILKALLKAGAKDAVIAVLYDPQVAKYAHEQGVGANITTALGAKEAPVDDETSLEATFKVCALGAGKFTGTGPFYKNCHIDLGPVALLAINEIKIIVASHKMQAADQSVFFHLGIDPSKEKILVLKSSVHYRADFEAIACAILIVAAPGLNIADLKRLNYKNIKPILA